MAYVTRVDVVLMTPTEFLVYPMPDGKAELVRGELRVTPPAGGPHACVTSNVHALLSAYVKGHGLGRAFCDGAGFELKQLPRTVRAPDASFVRADRLPTQGIGSGLMKLAPDLAVEVVSPSESEAELKEKVNDYRACGTPLIWVVDPVGRSVMIVSADSPARWLREGDVLDAGDVIPGFSFAVADLFEGLAIGP